MSGRFVNAENDLSYPAMKVDNEPKPQPEHPPKNLYEWVHFEDESSGLYHEGKYNEACRIMWDLHSSLRKMNNLKFITSLSTICLVHWAWNFLDGLPRQKDKVDIKQLSRNILTCQVIVIESQTGSKFRNIFFKAKIVKHFVRKLVIPTDTDCPSYQLHWRTSWIFNNRQKRRISIFSKVRCSRTKSTTIH